MGAINVHSPLQCLKTTIMCDVRETTKSNFVRDQPKLIAASFYAVSLPTHMQNERFCQGPFIFQNNKQWKRQCANVCNLFLLGNESCASARVRYTTPICPTKTSTQTTIEQFSMGIYMFSFRMKSDQGRPWTVWKTIWCSSGTFGIWCLPTR